MVALKQMARLYWNFFPPFKGVRLKSDKIRSGILVSWSTDYKQPTLPLDLAVTTVLSLVFFEMIAVKVAYPLWRHGGQGSM